LVKTSKANGAFRPPAASPPLPGWWCAAAPAPGATESPSSQGRGANKIGVIKKSAITGWGQGAKTSSRVPEAVKETLRRPEAEASREARALAAQSS